MTETEVLAEQFEANRPHLQAVAYRLLGSAAEADDAVQESWLRLNRADTSEVQNLRGWLTTVVARVCLDMLRSRKSRREASLDDAVPEATVPDARAVDPAQEAEVTDSVGVALLVVLETLQPAERLAFVLHDVFAVPFEEIAPIVGRSPDAARQLASRGRRRVQGASPTAEADRAKHRAVVDAFLAASRNGDFAALLSLLDPDVVLRADDAVIKAASGRRARGAPPFTPETRGAQAVATVMSGSAAAAQPALIDGAVGAAWAPGGRPRSVFVFDIENGKINEIDIMLDPETVGELDVVLLGE